MSLLFLSMGVEVWVDEEEDGLLLFGKGLVDEEEEGKEEVMVKLRRCRCRRGS